MKIRLLVLLALMQFNANAATVDTINVYSCLMQKDIKTVLVKPDGYKKRNAKFPVIYLLHGWSGSYANWVNKVPEIMAMADQYKAIVVCPDGGFDSWYFDSPINDSLHYESFISAELVHHIDNNYKTISSAKARAITGLSMGGQGGIRVGIRHARTFGAIGSMSGALDVTFIKDKKYGIEKRLGDSINVPSYAKRFSTFSIIDTLKPTGQKIIFDCGTEDFCLAFNDSLHQLLTKKKIPHDYIKRPGRHDWAYWSNAVQYQFLFFHNYFVANKEAALKEDE